MARGGIRGVMRAVVLGACLACAVACTDAGTGACGTTGGAAVVSGTTRGVGFADGARYARELWVDRAAGDDEAAGTRARPWRTLRRAGVGRRAGERVHVRAGTYFECLHIDRAQGTAVAPVAFVGEGEVRIAAEGCEAIAGSGLAYVVIEGFEVVRTGADANGIHVDGGSHHVVIRRNRVHGVGRGGDAIKVNASEDVWVLDNEAHDADARGGSSQGVDLVGVHRALVRGNHVHDIVGSQGMFAKGGSEDVVFEQNRLERITGRDERDADAIGIVLGGVTDPDVFTPRTAAWEARRLVARNNVIVGADGGGIAAMGCHDCLVANNTLWHCGRFGYALVLGPGAAGDASGERASHDLRVRVHNNLVGNPWGTMRAPLQAPEAERTGLVLSHNLWWNGERDDVFDPGYNRAVGVTEPASLVDVDPRVVEPEGTDLRLGPGSPARGRGRALPEVTDDHEGRCRAGAMDLGAYVAR